MGLAKLHGGKTDRKSEAGIITTPPPTTKKPRAKPTRKVSRAPSEKRRASDDGQTYDLSEYPPTQFYCEPRTATDDTICVMLFGTKLGVCGLKGVAVILNREQWEVVLKRIRHELKHPCPIRSAR